MEFINVEKEREMEMEQGREVEYQKVNDVEKALKITADLRNPDNGNASHRYFVSVQPEGKPSFYGATVNFQDGPIAEAGINGITNESLIAIVIDRLEGFQSSKFANEYNASALVSLRNALERLNARTLDRLERQVEGTHTV